MPLARLCALAAVIFAVAACTKSGSNNQSNSLSGNWIMLGSGGGISGGWYPATEFVMLSLGRDSSYQLRNSKTIIDSGRYSLGFVYFQPAGDSAPAIRMSHAAESTGYKITHDTLSLFEFAADGFITLYRRSR
jgi:hypothetical protein